MAITKMNDLVRHPVTQEVTTLAKLADAGLVEFRKVDNFHAPRGATGHRTAYFADIKGTTRGWEIGKMAYLFRTGQPVAPDTIAV